MSEELQYTKEQAEEYAKRQTKRKAKALQRSTGMKYTEALRQIKHQEEETIQDSVKEETDDRKDSTS